MRVIFYHVGKGDLSLILLPNGESILVDCYKADEAVEGTVSGTSSALDRIARRIIEHKLAIAGNDETNALRIEAKREEKGEQKIRIWMLAITHGDRDHILSKKYLLEHFDIQYLMDNGRQYANPSDTLKTYLDFREDMRRKDRYFPYRRAAYNVSPDSKVQLDVLCPNRDIASDEDFNNQCLVLRFSYLGKSFLFAGDTQIDDWVNPKYGILALHSSKVKSDVLHVSHHGSRTFFTPPGSRPEGEPDYKKEDFDTSALRAIQPQISFITCSDNEDAEHPHPIALEVYQELTNPGIKAAETTSHVFLSRETKNVHFIVDADGLLYWRTSRSRCDHSGDGPLSSSPYLIGTISSRNGYRDASGIWVVRDITRSTTSLSFTVTTKGQWSQAVDFDWRVLNNGQEKDHLHHEFYGMPASDSKKKSSWSRDLVYEGVHLMQCHATTEDGKDWANWCCPVCFESSLKYARRWITLFPTCIDPRFINP